MIDTSEYYGGTYPEPDWVHEEVEDTYEQAFNEDYDDYMADYYHDEMMLGLLD